MTRRIRVAIHPALLLPTDTDGMREIVATTIRGGRLAVHRHLDGDGWVVTHVATGRYVAQRDTKSAAIALATRLGALPVPWEDGDPDALLPWEDAIEAVCCAVSP